MCFVLFYSSLLASKPMYFLTPCKDNLLRVLFTTCSHEIQICNGKHIPKNRCIRGHHFKHIQLNCIQSLNVYFKGFQNSLLIQFWSVFYLHVGNIFDGFEMFTCKLMDDLEVHGRPTSVTFDPMCACTLMSTSHFKLINDITFYSHYTRLSHSRMEYMITFNHPLFKCACRAAREKNTH